VTKTLGLTRATFTSLILCAFFFIFGLASLRFPFFIGHRSAVADTGLGVGTGRIFLVHVHSLTPIDPSTSPVWFFGLQNIRNIRGAGAWQSHRHLELLLFGYREASGPQATARLGYIHTLLLTILFAALPARSALHRLLAIRADRQRRRRLARNLCPDCGYDLRATPGKCPECGHISERGENKGDRNH
jgi:hypothetical protein